MELIKYNDCFRYFTDDEIYVVFKGYIFVKDNAKEFKFIFKRNILRDYGHIKFFDKLNGVVL